ncbi:DUF4395 domain-containing protein [Paenibacillus xerothermodurans]|uniref:DUF4395 domain-containing protein n=1 Tax=Paenibacillus xerothermodurans TaxID=1977292 RepID=A0A2W1P3E9_PAEXE|nr:DUF4395 domain-containing protein [Paenibacillus xerothermodurans]PZE22232.1 DUF4395 domain-containing protein [Paenibacillus xerothermodurans]
MSNFNESSYDCVNDFPLHWVRGNQLGILLSVVASVLTQQAWVLVIPLAVQLISRWAGIRYNIFVRIFSPIFPKSSRTESRELLRFNNLLAILMLAVALIAWLLQATVLMYTSLIILSTAVVAALFGFCMGCFMYFQWKQFKARRRT